MSFALVGALLVAPPPRHVGAGEFAPAQRHEIENIVRNYLIANPSILTQALRIVDDKLKHDAESKAKEVIGGRQSEIFDDPATPVGGNPHGNVAIVEFFDYRCPYCKQVEPSPRALVNQDHQLRFHIQGDAGAPTPVGGRSPCRACRASPG